MDHMANASHEEANLHSFDQMEGQGMGDADFVSSPLVPPTFQLMASGEGEPSSGSTVGNSTSEQMSNSDWDDAVQMMAWDGGAAQRDESADPEKANPDASKVNNTGMPDDLKTGIENLSGFSMDDVKVHYNSDKPAQLLVYFDSYCAEIYIGPGQEQYLPHEAWHVVQQ